MGTGIVGLDLGPSTVMADQAVGLVAFCPTIRQPWKAFQRCYGRSVKVKAPGMFIQQLRRKAESAGGEFRELDTQNLKLSQYDHATGTFAKKPLSQRWHVLGEGPRIVQRDVYSAFLARCADQR